MQILAPTLTRDFFTPPTCTVSSRKGLGLAGNIQTSALDQLQGYAGKLLAVRAGTSGW